MMMWRGVKSGLALVLVLFSLGLLKPGEMIGGVTILLNLLLIDRFAFGTCPVFDDNCLLISIIAAFFVSNLRAAGSAPPDFAGRVPILLLQMVWLVLSGLIMFHSRLLVDSPASKWIPTFLWFGCAVFVLSTFGDDEPFSGFAVRSLMYYSLALMLYIGRDFGGECIIGSRGFLLCFYAVMFVSWPLACLFVLGALVVMIYMDQFDALLLGELDGREDYQIVQVAPSDPI